MITYTQLIILVKFLFQFRLINMDFPQSGEKSFKNIGNILGLEYVKGYYIYEVIFLISLFLHRYILRKFGLWKDANLDKTFDEPINSNSRRTSGTSTIFPGPEMSIAVDAQSIMASLKWKVEFSEKILSDNKPNRKRLG